jgi:ABC-2 type transport system ATP-binding protein
MASEPAIETSGLSKRYGGTTAVESLDLSIPSGAVYGFLGPNGAGKTTTMEMLTTLTRPTAGTARVAGESIDRRERVVPAIGYLPEEPPLFEELTGREQLSYIAGLRDLPEPAATKRIDDLLARFDLAEDIGKRIGAYSRGMKQKTGIVQALLHEPRVLFLDEPTSGLDPRAARVVRETIADLAAAEATIFLSTHILPVVDELADTVGVLADGELVAEGTPEALKRRAESDGERTLEDVFLDVTGEDAYAGAPDTTNPENEGPDATRERSA